MHKDSDASTCAEATSLTIVETLHTSAIQAEQRPGLLRFKEQTKNNYSKGKLVTPRSES